MALSGKFELVKNENLVENLIALGVPEEKCKLIDTIRPILEVCVDGKNVTITSNSEQFKNTTQLIFDEEIDETLATGMKIKSLTTEDGNKIKIFSKSPTGDTGTRVYEFLDKELIMSLKIETKDLPEAKRYYRRL